MARTRTSGFTVEGTGHFPIADSLAIDKSFMRGEREPYRVTLVTISETAPTVGRWESFGFRIVRESFKVAK